jgi:hypothetical protein
VPTATIASNLNFPAPLSVLGFLAAFAGLFLAVASVLIFWLARKPKFARISAIAAGAAAVVFFILRLSFSVASGETALAYGREKYFCEIDCHLAYSDLEAHTRPDVCFVITVRNRFDETATSRTRPKMPRWLRPRVKRASSTAPDARTLPSPAPALRCALRAGPPAPTPHNSNSISRKNATGLRLLITTLPQWPDKLVIGDENSWLRQKTYLALSRSSMRHSA